MSNAFPKYSLGENAMNEFQQYDSDLRACQLCQKELCYKNVDPSVDDEKVVPKPILTGIRTKPIMLIGQAPGIKEYSTGKPFQGQAGQDIRKVFAQVGVDEFNELVWSTAVVKCYPSRKWVKNTRRGGSRIEDETPSTRMVKNCQSFLEHQIELVKPRVVVTLGGFPIKAYLRLRGRKVSEGKLSEFVGRSEEWEGRKIIFFPHTSGSSRWLNSPENSLY
jgi:uracil-DNA glycosylase family 4